MGKLLDLLEESGERQSWDWTRLPAQQDFLTTDKTFSLYSGGFGNGKTSVLCAKVLWCSLTIPNNLGYLGRQDGKALRHSTMVSLKEMLEKEYLANSNDQLGFMQLKPEYGGSRILYGDFKDMDDLKNMPLGWFAIDQCEEVTEETWKMLVGRLRRRTPILNVANEASFSVAGACPARDGQRHRCRLFYVKGNIVQSSDRHKIHTCNECGETLPPYTTVVNHDTREADWELDIYPRFGFAVCNPMGPSHWLYQMFPNLPGPNDELSKGQSDEYFSATATAYDGLHAGYTDKKYIEEMEKQYQDIPKMFDRFIWGKWVEAEGAVYPGWSRLKHMIPGGARRHDGTDLIPRDALMFEAGDHGTTSPTAWQWWVIEKCACGCKKYNFFLVDEHYQAGKTVSYHADVIKTKRSVLPYTLHHTELDNKAFHKMLSGTPGSKRQDQLYSVADEYSDYGVYPTPSMKDWAVGYNRISELLQEDPVHKHPVTGAAGASHLQVLHQCEWFMWEIEKYRWSKTRPDDPVDKDDHHMDAMNDFMVGRPEMLLGSEFDSPDEEDEDWEIQPTTHSNLSMMSL